TACLGTACLGTAGTGMGRGRAVPRGRERPGPVWARGPGSAPGRPTPGSSPPSPLRGRPSPSRAPDPAAAPRTPERGGDGPSPNGDGDGDGDGDGRAWPGDGGPRYGRRASAWLAGAWSLHPPRDDRDDQRGQQRQRVADRGGLQ